MGAKIIILNISTTYGYNLLDFFCSEYADSLPILNETVLANGLLIFSTSHPCQRGKFHEVVLYPNLSTINSLKFTKTESIEKRTQSFYKKINDKISYLNS